MNTEPSTRHDIATTDAAPHHPDAGWTEARREFLARWNAALSQGDHREVDRIVREERSTRSTPAPTRRLGDADDRSER